MHLLPRDLHSLDDSGAATDLGQTPADIVFLSFSDSELRLVARLHAQDGALPGLRCAPLAQLTHPYSVDLYLDTVARHAKLIVVRLLGGKEYWAYGVEQLEALARARNISLALVPGDTVEDLRLTQASTLHIETLTRIWRFFQDGGPENIRSFLGYASTLAGRPADWCESVTVANAGRFEAGRRFPYPHAEEAPRGAVSKHEGKENSSPTARPRPSRRPLRGLLRMRTLSAIAHKTALRATIVFYRSLYLADDTAPIVALADALSERGFAVDALYVASLKEPESEAFVAQALDAFAPDIILNATAFSARRDSGAVLDRADAPVLQVALATCMREAWENSARGANGADLAMNIVLPEVDGRIFTRAISFKETAERGAAELNEPRHAPDTSRIAFVADLAANWARLRRKPNSEKSLALILSDYPARRGRGGYAIGLDVEASVAEIVAALREADYSLDSQPSLRAEGEVIQCDNISAAKRPSLFSFERKNEECRPIIRALEDATHVIDIPVADYRAWLSDLPAEFVATISETWGAPHNDPSVIGDAFRFSCIVGGNLLIALQPDRGARTARYETYHDMQRPPRHAYVAFYLWLRHAWKIDALLHLGAHGTLEWLPGKSVMLSETCAPEAVLGPTPLIYPFIVNDPGEAAQAKRRTGAVTIGHLTPPLVEAGLFDAAAAIETLLDEYATAASLDPRRAKLIAGAILDEAERSGLAAECGVTRETDIAETLTRLDAWMCDLKEMRIGDGLHVFGRADDDPVRNACAASERRALIHALSGRFVEPGPAGAPSRGRADVIPTGRNLFCIDPRHAPTQTAYDIGRRAAHEIMTRHAQTHGEYPRHVMLDLWGSATIRTGGEDFAQALALLGVAPRWDAASARVIGFEILPQAKLDFPRVDVTLHVSGLFRDMFPGLIALFDDAVRAVAALDEDPAFNPLKEADGLTRIFGAAQGSYGLGVSDKIVRGEWLSRDDLASAYLQSGGHALDRAGESAPAMEAFSAQVARAEAHVHVQDMAEVDVLAGPAFADFEGGFAAANKMLGGDADFVHLDATRPENLRARPLRDEIARALRMRLANPRWLERQMRHGHRGGAEIAEGIDNLYAFAATSGLVSDAQFDLAFSATLGDDKVRAFLARENPRALEAVAHVFNEALRRALWRSQRNSVRDILSKVGGDHVAGL
ncbi:cobaltochelatase subunit CobN [Methylocystis parvus]|uniref:Cobaltochelatase subunit CobN n=1 Tax=Methylocystis parvus TaxID=134 RepID=A0A6B8M1J3_9HYPH|nr:cobaltochelatase subunit CobN [Methylocystis parvus]QGM96126.1 cobaltochelatase subunit CobN [Methylocystis parvus]WBK00052.1 cobaltochelatase subunit CobN [Methylocystis parvus OBBP]